ncbi:hypothetical protein [Teichococcus aestuarii]|uniref:hypothetical protein n=1 Tax=Teichococcus aestuarii TaxID=568898 RepID=UPI0036091E45
MSVVIIGGGPAGRAALALLPGARLVARPAATAWHATPGRIWVEDASGVHALPFTRLLLCADEPLLLLALGCAFAHGRPVVDGRGETSVPGIFAAGAILGAATPEAAALQAGIAARALAGQPVQGAIAPPPPRPLPEAPRRDPGAMAALLATPPGPARNAAALAEALRQSPPAPARPVGFAALAALAGAPPDPLPAQADQEALA